MRINRIKAVLRSRRNSGKITQKQYERECNSGAQTFYSYFFDKRANKVRRKTKNFSFLQVLNLTSGRLVTTLDDIYNLLNYLTGDNLFTHQLPIANNCVSPLIIKKYPVFSDPLMLDDLESFCEEIKDNKELNNDKIREEFKKFSDIWTKLLKIDKFEFKFKESEFSDSWKNKTTGVMNDLIKMRTKQS